MNTNVVKGSVALMGAAVGAYFHELIAPVAVLGIVMVLDYCTGLVRAWTESSISSRTGVLGIIKKAGYLCVVAVAIVVDWVIQTSAATIGYDLGGIYVFGLLVTVWLILNECISVLENAAAIGVPMPAFLMRIVAKLKQTAEQKGDDLSK